MYGLRSGVPQEWCARVAKNRDTTCMPLSGAGLDAATLAHMYVRHDRGDSKLVASKDIACLFWSIIRALSTDICIPKITSQISRFQRVVFVINLGVRHSWCT